MPGKFVQLPNLDLFADSSGPSETPSESQAREVPHASVSAHTPVSLMLETSYSSSPVLPAPPAPGTTSPAPSAVSPAPLPGPSLGTEQTPEPRLSGHAGAAAAAASGGDGQRGTHEEGAQRAGEVS